MIREDYEIVSIDAAEAPQDLEGADWYRYVIGRGTNRICGYRQGSLMSITESVEELVQQLNARRFGKKGRVHLDMSSRGKPAATK